jgi:hypothetical protein
VCSALLSVRATAAETNNQALRTRTCFTGGEAVSAQNGERSHVWDCCVQVYRSARDYAHNDDPSRTHTSGTRRIGCKCLCQAQAQALQATSAICVTVHAWIRQARRATPPVPRATHSGSAAPEAS